MKVVITVDGGLVSNVYSDTSNVSVEVIDMDTDDYDTAMENEKKYDALDHKVNAGTLFNVY